MAGVVGASLAMVGAALQALFRNPLADPFTLGVSGGASLGASVAIVFGLGLNLVGVPFIFIAAFVGASVSVLLVYRLARSGGGTMLPGALLLAGVAFTVPALARDGDDDRCAGTRDVKLVNGRIHRLAEIQDQRRPVGLF